MLTLLFCALLQSQRDLKAGFGDVDITPETGASLPGRWRATPAKGVLDPLFAVACVVSDGTTSVALVGVDGIFIGKQTVKQARERIAKNTKIPAANVLVGASLTTTGGPLHLCHGVEADPAYQERVANAVAKAVEDAWAALKPCEVGVGIGIEGSISFNRRFLMKDGKEITHPGKPGTPHHARIVRPAGPIDPDVGVLAVRNPGGTVKAMNWMKALSISSAAETVPVKIRPEPDVAAERPAFGLGSGPEDVYAAERKRVAVERERTPVVDCEVQGLRIGPLGIATNGAGYFAEYGLRVKQASPHAFTWFVGLANEYIGYVPTAQAFVGGGYETRTAPTSKLAPDGGQKLLEGALRVLNRVLPKGEGR